MTNWIKTTVRLKPQQVRAIKELEVNQSDAIRFAVDRMIVESEDIPEGLKTDAKHRELVAENKANMRLLHWRGNVKERLKGFILGDENMGTAPPPEWVEELYIDSLREQVNEEFPDGFKKPQLEWLEQMSEWYADQYPSQSPSDGPNVMDLDTPDTEQNERDGRGISTRSDALKHIQMAHQAENFDRAKRIAKEAAQQFGGPGESYSDFLIEAVPHE